MLTLYERSVAFLVNLGPARRIAKTMMRECVRPLAFELDLSSMLRGKLVRIQLVGCRVGLKIFPSVRKVNAKAPLVRPLLAFVTSRHTDQDNEMYAQWKDCHERMLRPPSGEDIETVITPVLYDALDEQVKARGLAYIPELADHQDKPIALLLIKAGTRKRLVNGRGFIEFSIE